MPRRLADIRPELALLLCSIDSGKGSHLKVRRAGMRPYTLPCHNGERTELSDLYLKGLARALGLDQQYFIKKR